jgi:hypothetical protein
LLSAAEGSRPEPGDRYKDDQHQNSGNCPARDGVGPARRRAARSCREYWK